MPGLLPGIAPYMNSGATFSECGSYRYSLFRIWGDPQQRAAFLMLNPSTADETKDDPTIRRCIGFAKAWGLGALDVINIFALRSTDPRALYKHPDPVGLPWNDSIILDVARHAEIVVAAWGVHGAYENRGQRVVEMLRGAGVEVQALGVTKGGHPKHPLYLPSNSKLVRYP
jgi:hypothetical protein